MKTIYLLFNGFPQAITVANDGGKSDQQIVNEYGFGGATIITEQQYNDLISANPYEPLPPSPEEQAAAELKVKEMEKPFIWAMFGEDLATDLVNLGYTTYDVISTTDDQAFLDAGLTQLDVDKINMVLGMIPT